MVAAQDLAGEVVTFVDVAVGQIAQFREVG
jgi:hypothetical protein